jgi:hypothetical protein
VEAVLATFTWTSGVSGDWNTGLNWSTGGPPDASDAGAVIDATGTYTVTISDGETANTVTLDAAGAELSVASGGTLTLTGTAPALTVNAGTFDLAGLLVGGTVTAAGGTLMVDSGATLDGVTWQGPLTLGADADLNVLGGLSVQTAPGGVPGTIDASAGGAAIFVTDSETLDNVTLALGSTGGDILYNYDMAGGTLTLGSGFVLNQSGGFDDLINEFTTDTIVDAGDINVTGGELTVFFNTFTNSGTISVTGGGVVDLSNTTLTLSGGITVSAGGSVVVGNVASDTGSLAIGGGGTLEQIQTSAGDVSFSGTGGELVLDQNSGNTGTISGFAPGDTIFLSALPFSGVTTPQSLSGSSLKIVESATTVTLQLNATDSFSGDIFHLTSDPLTSDTIVTLSVACFAAGTHIATQGSETPVEALRPGDVVLSMFGGIREVVWIGHRHIDCLRHPNPALVWPVHVAPDAFGPGQPARDLYLSPDHAVYMSGSLVPIRLLANGTTIRQRRVPTVTYYHVELARHDVVLAEGLPAETYLDTGNRTMFQNGGDAVVAHADFDAAQEAREAGSCVTFLSRPDEVEPLWRALAVRSKALGWQPPETPATVDDPDLHILVGSLRLQPLTCKDGRYTFVLPDGGDPRFLVSRAARPCDTRPWVDDQRRLGVRVRNLTLRNGSEVRAVAMDDTALDQGWWAVESAAGAPCRWTTGHARLPCLGSCVLEVELDGVAAYSMQDAGTSGWGTGTQAA